MVLEGGLFPISEVPRYTFVNFGAEKRPDSQNRCGRKGPRQPNPSGDTTSCRVTGVTLQSHVRFKEE